MYFQHPTILLLLWVLPGVAGLLVYAQKKRKAAARRFVDQPMMARLMPRLGGGRPWVKGGLIVLGLALLIVAAARPRFGVYFEKVKARGVNCFVLLDVSRSMLAEDVAPSRLERAKSDIRDLLKKLVGDRVGLIVFAGKPVLKVPLTTDDGFFRTVLDEVDTHSAPRGGTLIGDAIRKALAAMPPRADHDQVLVLISDGEDQESYPLEAAKQAAERGIKIFTIGLGDSSEGARIPLRDDAGKLQYLKESEGQEHWSKADQDVLKHIALATGGAHIPAGTRSYDLGQIYEDHLAGLTRGGESENIKRKLYREQFQLFLALGIALLAVEALVSAYTRSRSQTDDASPIATARNRGTAVVPKLLLLGAICLPGLSPTTAYADQAEAATKVGEGLDAFRKGDFKLATEAFAAANQSLPNEPRVAFNRGCAYAAAGDLDKAAEQFLAAAMAPDHKLAAAAHYNLGCLAVSKAKARFGQKPEDASPDVRKEGIELLVQAAGNFRDCLAVDPQYADARYNLETLRLWIKHIGEVWKQRDREKRRQEMNLLEFLQMLESEQRGLRTTNRELAALPDSPRRREAIRADQIAQRSLAEEIEPLKEKVRAALAGPQAGPNQPPPNDADLQRAGELLNRLADEVHGAMSAAADSLTGATAAESLKLQSEAVEKLDQIFMAVAPFVNLVQKAVGIQEGLISTPDAEENGDSKEKKAKPVNEDLREAAWNQRFISGYGRILPAKAKRELEQLEKAPAPPAAAPEANKDKGDDKNQKEQSAAEQQKELKRALQAGVDLAPKVEKLSADAAAALDAGKLADARPSQQEALKLLKEMLPKQNQDQKDQEKKNEDKKQQDKKDQQKKDQDKKDQDKKDQQKKDEEKKDQQEKDQGKKDQEKKDQQKQDKKQDQKDQQEQKSDLSKQQAEAVLRKAKERQQERREMEKALQEYLYRPDKVDKDW